jgi:hypothetical protein
MMICFLGPDGKAEEQYYKTEIPFHGNGQWAMDNGQWTMGNGQ